MAVAVCKLKSVSPYSQSKHYEVDKLEKESHADYEKRTWRERCHYDSGGNLFIPPMAFKNGIAEAAKRLAMKIPGKGQKTYTAHFEGGVLVMDPVPLPFTKDAVPGEWLFVPSDGKRGSGSRVSKCFPLVHEWEGDVTFHILDETITLEVFKAHLKEFGMFVGVGRFRPKNNGYYGRFSIVDIQWQK